MNYYNENNKKVAAWLERLVAAGVLPSGDVDSQSIVDVEPRDLKGYTQHHFFAGIGGWPYALKLAGWNTDRPVWTGSCPCQPLSCAGKGLGAEDERHLWPEFHRLIAEHRPSVVLGENVASKLGREWLAGVRLDLETLGYAFGAADLCAASVAAPHMRQRLFWVANANRINGGRTRRCTGVDGGEFETTKEIQGLTPFRGLEHSKCKRSEKGPNVQGREKGCGDPGAVCGLDNTDSKGPQGRSIGTTEEGARPPRTGFWDNPDFVKCADGKTRRVESGILPLAHGVPGRVVKIRGYGNAIVPQVAAEFIKAFCETENNP